MALQEELKTQGDFLFKNRSYLPLIILVVGLAVYAYGKYTNTMCASTCCMEVYLYASLAVSLFGQLIRVLTVGYTPHNTSGRNTSEGQVAGEVNSTGIYSTVRHPLYLGNFFMWLGVAMITANAWFIVAFILFYMFYYERIMYAEEAFLRNKFDRGYLDWADRTPAIIPSFKNYEKSRYPFSLKKVLKMEKNGLVATFTLFWLFDYAGQIIDTRQFNVEMNFWFFAAVASFVIYLVIKAMKSAGMLETKDR